MRFAAERGDIVVADRGYAHRDGLVEQGAAAVVRLNRTSFPLLDHHGKPLALLHTLRTLDGEKPASWQVQFESGGKRYNARLCAVRLPSDLNGDRLRAQPASFKLCVEERQSACLPRCQWRLFLLPRGRFFLGAPCSRGELCAGACGFGVWERFSWKVIDRR